MTDKEKIREDLKRLQTNINECIDDLAIARDRKDDGDEQIVLRRMESLLADVKQTCTSILNVMQEEPVSEELDKAAIKFSKGWGEWDYAIPCFKAGANWHKDQMLKGAVEAKVSASLAKELGVKVGSKVIILMKD